MNKMNIWMNMMGWQHMVSNINLRFLWNRGRKNKKTRNTLKLHKNEINSIFFSFFYKCVELEVEEEKNKQYFIENIWKSEYLLHSINNNIITDKIWNLIFKTQNVVWIFPWKLILWMFLPFRFSLERKVCLFPQ